MIIEAGHFALILGLAFAMMQAIVCLMGASRGDGRMMALGPFAAYAQFILVLGAFLALMYAYITSDFSVANVAQNSHSLKPLLYKISGVWGNHEGSILLWTLILALFGALVAWSGRHLPRTLRARVLGIQALLGGGFYFFLLLTSNPFLRIYPFPPEGNGLNPLLQDPGLAFHPPFLYLGYVGLSVPFAFAVAALMEGRLDKDWARWVRPWTLLAWAFLTIGITLGSWWAYYELGWGGWWFWDPVENASFMPWLTATALLHSAIVVEKRDTLKSWTVLLALIAFSFSLLGTFIVRSGVLTSVHAFATDPERGVFILIFLGLVVGGSFLLFALRADRLTPGGLFAPVSRESALVLNNLFLSVAAAVVLFGTLYPLLSDAIAGIKATVGAPFFATIFSLLMIPMVMVMGMGPHLSWKRADLKGVSQRMTFIFGASLLGVLVTFFVAEGGRIMPALWIGLGMWLLLSSLSEVAGRIKLFRAPLRQTVDLLKRQTRASWGMTLGHLGLAVMILGITATSSWNSEFQGLMKTGDSQELAGFNITFQGVEPVAGPNYSAVRGRFLVDDEILALPESRTYAAPPMTTTEAAIFSGFTGDLFIVIGEEQGVDKWGVRIYHKPLQLWLWLGAAIMVLGAFISLTDRRFRKGVAERVRADA